MQWLFFKMPFMKCSPRMSHINPTTEPNSTFSIGFSIRSIIWDLSGETWTERVPPAEIQMQDWFLLLWHHSFATQKSSLSVTCSWKIRSCTLCMVSRQEKKIVFLASMSNYKKRKQIRYREKDELMNLLLYDGSNCEDEEKGVEFAADLLTDVGKAHFNSFKIFNALVIILLWGWPDHV